ncbi:DUF72 domain-containing protein [Roseomonas sp. WA12]
MEGSHLQRYAGQLSAVEINSSFYRPHRPSTYARWAASAPPGFRFAVKVPREITHDRRLVDTAAPLERFLGEIAALGEALGPLLVQLPPSLAFDAASVRRFLAELRERSHDGIACEPRHPSWFTDSVDALLSEFQVARVAADPAVVPRAAQPGGWPGLAYHRLHGSPKVYYSAYPPDVIETVARHLGEPAPGVQERWCIFDNTALGEATRNALDLTKLCG